MLKALPVMILLMAAPLAVFAQEEGPSIITKSPFLPPNFQPPRGTRAAAQAAKSGQYEFRGVYQMGGLYHFNLYNLQQKKGTWVTEGETTEDAPTIVRYQLNENELVVNLNGKEVTLNMIQTSDKTLPVKTATITKTTTRTTQARKPSATPIRRRVIRPSSRTPSSRSSQPVRRQTLPATNNSNPNEE